MGEQETSLRPAASGTSRAAEAAARVAARYAKAPTYSQMQAEGARVAVRAAEIATQVALEAQAAAETALAEMHAASQEQPARRPAVVQSITAPVRKPEAETPALESMLAEVDQRSDSAPRRRFWSSRSQRIRPSPLLVQDPCVPKAYEIRWDPDLPVRPAERKPQPREPEEFALAAEDWWEPAEGVEDLRSNPIEFDQDEPAHANLIEFPRELVAKRKMRPRLAEGQLTEAEGQLSIFEVDPASVSTQVEVPGTDPDVSCADLEPFGMVRLETGCSAIRGNPN